MKLSKKIVILAIAIVVLILGILYALVNSNKKPYAPINFTFDKLTGKVEFIIEEGYKIHRIQVLEGHLDVPYFDKETIIVSFPSWELEVGEHEFVWFAIQNYEGEVNEQYNVQYEILHQSANEIIISVTYGNSKYPGVSDMYFFEY